MSESPKKEIVSFNEAVPELSKLLELDGAELDRVIGGNAEPLESICSALTNCTTYDGMCSNLTTCGTYTN